MSLAWIGKGKRFGWIGIGYGQYFIFIIRQEFWLFFLFILGVDWPGVWSGCETTYYGVVSFRCWFECWRLNFINFTVQMIYWIFCFLCAESRRRFELIRIRQIYVPELILRLHNMLFTSRQMIPEYVDTVLLCFKPFFYLISFSFFLSFFQKFKTGIAAC